MTRKLAVTVFAMSLTVVGCGSSSTTKVDAGKKDAISPVADTGSTPDVITQVGPDVGSGPDVVQTQPDAAVDTNRVSGPEVGTPDGGVDAEDGGSVSGPEGGTTKPDGAIDVPVFKPDAPDADRPDSETGDGGDGGDADGGEVG